MDEEEDKIWNNFFHGKKGRKLSSIFPPSVLSHSFSSEERREKEKRGKEKEKEKEMGRKKLGKYQEVMREQTGSLKGA